ncbi:MAG: hypothetical protein GVY22_13195 [Gammaproteobacteria bacterium]|jgi:hypothetical protein|nr:hypothetical protein [Gammaproteobacteria bacterium]
MKRTNPLSPLSLSLVLLTGCVTTGQHVTDWGEITLAPGDTGVCHSNPCRVFFEMPPGQETYRLRGTAFPIGEYPAGKTAMIGSFFESSVIQVVGADVPKTYIYVPNASGEVE